MIDDSGAELCVLYFTVSNTNLTSQPANKANTFYVKAANRVVEAKVGNHWSKLSEISGMDNSVCHLGPGQQFECLLLAPAGIDTFRVWLKCARPARPFTLNAISESIALRLPLSVRSRISYKFWRWIGFPASGPSRDWQEVCVELALPPATIAGPKGN
jgi:hypothetical protein